MSSTKHETKYKTKQKKATTLNTLHNLITIVRRGLRFRNQDAAWTIDTRSWW
jgi:hypothetical protein